MATNRFHYQILRYIPDLERMEPRNFGIVLQGSGQTKCRINTRFAQKGYVDTEAFRKWRQFIEQEITCEETEQLQMFCPPKGTPEFLEHLQSLIQGNFNITRPMGVEYRREIDIDAALNELFDSLVVEREEQDAVAPTRPTGRFRAASEDRAFLKRGMRENAHVNMDSGTEPWIAYRIYENGSLNIIEKVEFNRDLRRTAQELNSLLRFVPNIPDGFLSKGNMIHLILDPHKQFLIQTDDESERYRKDREELGNRATGKNLIVYETPDRVQELIEQVNGVLPQLQKMSVQ